MLRVAYIILIFTFARALEMFMLISHCEKNKSFI